MFAPKAKNDMLARMKIGLALWVLCLSVITVSAGNWARFRGPDGAGQSDDQGIPSVWTKDDCVWRVDLPGVGHSSPVVWDDRVFVTSALEADGTKIIQSLSTRDGSLIWEKRFPTTPSDLGRSTSHDKSTPAVDAERIYLVWASTDGYQVEALDQRSGEEVWRRHLGSFSGEHGSGASPIRYQDLLIVPNDQTGPSSTVALDCATGAIRWSVDRRSVKTAYSTPFIYHPDDGPVQLIQASTAHGVSSLDPDTGRLHWELPDVFGTIRVTGSPVAASGLIFAQCGAGGAGKRMVAVKPPDPVIAAPAKVAYEVAGSVPYVPTPVAHGNWLFIWNDSGIVSCIDAAGGERVWRERVGGSYFGSPIRVGDRIYCISREGEVVVIAAKPEFELLGRVDLEEGSHSTPAVADGVMYLRTFSQLMAVGGSR